MDLPTEILYDIFHFAARTSLSFCYTLAQVSSWTQRIANTYLYRTLIVKSLKSKRNLVSILTKPGDQSLHTRNAIRHVWLSQHTGPSYAIFERCTRITHIAVHASNLRCLIDGYTLSILTRNMHSAELGPTTTRSKRPDLDLAITGFIKDDDKSPWSAACLFEPSRTSRVVILNQALNSITRLRLPCTDEKVNLAPLKRLTHLAAPYRGRTTDLSNFSRMKQHPSLRFLIIIVLEDLISQGDHDLFTTWYCSTLLDESTVKVTYRRCTSSSYQTITDWEAEMRERRSFWD